MSDTQAAMREFRFLDEKRKTNGLTPAEQERWQQLGTSLGVELSEPDPSTQGYYGQDGQWYQYPPGYDPNAWAAQQAGGWPGYYPPQGYYDPNTGAWYPYPAYYDPNTGAYYPAQPGYGYPPQQGWPQAQPQALYGEAPQWPQEAYQQGGWPQQPPQQQPQEQWADPAHAYQAPMEQEWPSQPEPQSQVLPEPQPQPEPEPEPAPTLIEEPRAEEEQIPVAVSFQQSRASGLRSTPHFGSFQPAGDTSAVGHLAPLSSAQAAPRASSPSGFGVLGPVTQPPSDPAPALRFPSGGFFAPASNPAFQPLPSTSDDELGRLGLVAEPDEHQAQSPETTPLLAELADEDTSPLLGAEAANDTPMSAPGSNGLPRFSSLGSTPEISSDEVMDLDGAQSPPAPPERHGRAPAADASPDDVMEIQDEEVVEILPSASAPPPSAAPVTFAPPPAALDSVEDLRNALSLEDDDQRRPPEPAPRLKPSTAPAARQPEPTSTPRPFLADLAPEPTATMELMPVALLDVPEAPPELVAPPEPQTEPPESAPELEPLASFLEMDVAPEAPLLEAPETIEALPELGTDPLEEAPADEAEPITLVQREAHDEAEPITLIPKQTVTPVPASFPTPRPVVETMPLAAQPATVQAEPWPVAPPSSSGSKYPQLPSLAPPPSPSSPVLQPLAPPPAANHPFPDFRPLNPPTSPAAAKPFSQFRITPPATAQTPEAEPSTHVGASTPSAFDGLALPPDATPIPTFSEPFNVPEDRDTSPFGHWAAGPLEPLPQRETTPSHGQAQASEDWGDLPVVEAEHAETPLEGSPSDQVELAGPAEFVQWSHDPAAPDTHDFQVDTDLTDFVLESGPAAALATGVSATATSGFDAEPVPLATNAEFLSEPGPIQSTLPWPDEPEAPAEEEPLVEGELIPEVEGEAEGELDVDVDFAGPPFSPPPPPPPSRPLTMVDAPAPQRRPSQPLPAPIAVEPQRRPPQPLPTPVAPAPSFPKVPPLSEPMPIPKLSPPGALSAAAAAAKLGTSPVPLNPPLAAPAPSPPRTEMTPVMIEGEHRVILRTMEGGVKRGAIRDVNLASAQVILQTNPGVNESVPRERVKAIFFMLSPGSRAPEPEGIKVRVTFRDGRQVAGYSKDHRSGASGFFVVPADHRTNTERIFIYRHSVTSVSVES